MARSSSTTAISSSRWQFPSSRGTSVPRTARVKSGGYVAPNMRAALLIALLVSTAQAATQPADWRQFRGGPQLTGVALSTLPDTPKVAWTYESGDVIESSAAIAGGLVFAGVGNGTLTALDLNTGAVKWKYATGALLGESSPAVSAGVVYVGDLDGTLHAVSAADG